MISLNMAMLLAMPLAFYSKMNSSFRDPFLINFILVIENFDMQVRYLKIIEKSGYQALPWVRYITMAGEYELRLI